MAIITGDNGNNSLPGRSTSDFIDALGGNDFVNGLGGNDLVLGGSGNDTLFGNFGSDVLDGGSGNDTIEGEFGSDVLTGGANADRFVFRNGPNGSADIITDFVVADDTLVFEDFQNTAQGTLSAAAFRIGASAADATDRFIYNNTTGDLFFDQDGLGGIAQVRVASLSTNLALTNNDFSIIA